MLNAESEGNNGGDHWHAAVDPLMQRMPMEVDDDDEADDGDMVEEADEEEEEAAEVVDRTMEVTQEEIVAAYEIKLSFQQDAGGGGTEEEDDEETPLPLQPLTDYEYMQYSLTTYDETPEQRLHRAHCLQAFREEYRIQDTVEEGMQILDEFSRDVWPGFLLQFEKILPQEDSADQIVCMITNWAHWDPTKINSPKRWRLFMGTFYYSLQLRMCNFHAMRVGARVMAECATYSQYDETFSARFTFELYSVYPCNHERLLFCNTPSIFNFGYACFKKYHTKSWQQKLVLGYKIPGFDDEPPRLEQIYQSPTPEIARRRMLHNARQLLEERYRNQRNYVLPP